MKRCSTYVIRELKNKTWKLHYTLTRQNDQIQNTTLDASKDMEQELLFIADEIPFGTLWKTVWQFLVKLNILLPIEPAITLLGIYPKKLKT